MRSCDYGEILAVQSRLDQGQRVWANLRELLLSLEVHTF